MHCTTQSPIPVRLYAEAGTVDGDANAVGQELTGVGSVIGHFFMVPSSDALCVAAGAANDAGSNAGSKEVADLESVLEDMYEKVEELQQVLKEHLSTKNALKVCVFCLGARVVCIVVVK